MSRFFSGITTSGFDVIEVGSPSLISNIFSGGGTVCFWLKANSTAIALPRFMDKSTTTTSGSGWFISQNAASATSAGIGFNRDFTLVVGSWASGAGGTSFNIAKWTHAAITYNENNSSNVPIFWINGNSVGLLIGSTAAGVAVSDVTRSLLIGNNSNSIRALSGNLAHISLFGPNITLSRNEINQEMSLPGSVSRGRVAYYPLWGSSPEWDYSGIVGSGGTVTGTTVGKNEPNIVAMNIPDQSQASYSP